LACSLILSRINYCNALLHGARAATIHKLQRVQNNVARIVVQAPKRSDAKPLLQRLHWLPVEQRIIYTMAVLTFKIPKPQRQLPQSSHTVTWLTVCEIFGRLTLPCSPLPHFRPISVVPKRLPISVTAELVFLHDTAVVDNIYNTTCRRSSNEGFWKINLIFW